MGAGLLQVELIGALDAPLRSELARRIMTKPRCNEGRLSLRFPARQFRWIRMLVRSDCVWYRLAGLLGRIAAAKPGRSGLRLGRPKGKSRRPITSHRQRWPRIMHFSRRDSFVIPLTYTQWCSVQVHLPLPLSFVAALFSDDVDSLDDGQRREQSIRVPGVWRSPARESRRESWSGLLVDWSQSR